MRKIAILGAAALAIAACSANGGSAAGHGSLAGGLCAMDDGCSGCSNCFEACLCWGGTESQCLPACFDDVSPPDPGPPPPDPGPPPPDPGPPPPDPAPPPPAAWPAGPYGTTVGTTVREDYFWEGYVDGAAVPSGVAIRDLYDPDGSKGINAILILESTVWCGSCRQTASELNTRMASGWTAQGVKVLELMVEDLFGNPATLMTAEAWKNEYQAQGWSSLVDPHFTFAAFGQNGLPVHIVVNPRDMKIVDRRNGYSPFHPSIDQLVQQNGAF